MILAIVTSILRPMHRDPHSTESDLQPRHDNELQSEVRGVENQVVHLSMHDWAELTLTLADQILHF